MKKVAKEVAKVVATKAEEVEASNAKKVSKMVKTVAAVNTGEVSPEKLSPAQKKIVKTVNELTGVTPAVEAEKLPSKKEVVKAKKAAETKIPISHEAEVEALVNEVTINAENRPKRRAPKGEIIVPVVKTSTGKPWGKFGRHGYNQELEGFAAGDRVMFNLKGVPTEGIYSHFHIDNHQPKGYLTIKIGKKIFWRAPGNVTKVVEAIVKPIDKKVSKKVTV